MTGAIISLIAIAAGIWGIGFAAGYAYAEPRKKPRFRPQPFGRADGGQSIVMRHTKINAGP